MSWTDERVALLKKLWGDGKTAAEIAKALGGSFTRNAVIGKAHRLKLSSRLSPITPPPRKMMMEAANTQTRHVSPPRARVAPIPATKIITKGIKLIDLKERMCRWPLGDPKDPEFNFCGCNSVPGLPYCADHARLAFQVNKRSRLFTPDENATPDAEDDLIKSVISN